jgi:amidophosphoribosyltransferase
VNAPYGITFVHNGNLTNTLQLEQDLFRIDRRHTNSTSDTEMLLNVLATEVQSQLTGRDLTPDQLFDAVASLHHRVQGSYAAIALIAGHGMLAFRDPYGIRPLILGRRLSEQGREEWIVASESLVIENSGYEIVRDVDPGEAIFIDVDANFYQRQCADSPRLIPCAFEYVYLARPDSLMNGISVYESRLRMGDRLAKTISETLPAGDIDVVMPIPDSARPSAMQVAKRLGLDYREGFYKNRYVGRTFIMPGQAERKKSVRQKLNALGTEFAGKNVLIVDDSIVRGTTSREIVQMARSAGANKVTFTSAAPPVRYPNVYGINMPTRAELLAHGRTIDDISDVLGADHVVYQTVENLLESIVENTDIKDLEMSCFDGHYVTGGIDEEYFQWLEQNCSS